jgi:hypothetical protein
MQTAANLRAVIIDETNDLQTQPLTPLDIAQQSRTSRAGTHDGHAPFPLSRRARRYCCHFLAVESKTCAECRQSREGNQQIRHDYAARNDVSATDNKPYPQGQYSRQAHRCRDALCVGQAEVGKQRPELPEYSGAMLKSNRSSIELTNERKRMPE